MSRFGANSRTVTSPTGISAGKWLQTRKSQQGQEKKYSFMDSSSDESFNPDRFIKTDKTKKEESKPLPKSKQKTASFESVRPKTSRGSEPQRSKTLQSDSALSRFAQLEEQILSRHKTERVSLSVSDLDISSDLEIKKDAEKIREERKAITQQYNFLGSSSEDENAKFIKSNKSATLPKSESLSQPKASSSKKTVSFAPDLIQDTLSDSERSLDDFLPSKSQSEDEISSFDDVLPTSTVHTIKTLDEMFPDAVSLEPTNMSGLQSVDELLPGAMYDSDHSSESTTSTTSEMKMHNVHYMDDLPDSDKSSTPTPTIPTNEPDVSELPKLPNVFRASSTVSRGPKQVFKSVEVVRASLDDVPDIEEYSDDFHSKTQSITQEIEQSITQEIEQSVTQEIETVETESSTSSTARSVSESYTVTERSESASDEPPYTETFESETETRTPRERKVKSGRKGPRADMATQTETDKSAGIRLPKGLSAEDAIIFEPSRLVSSEALASLTTYSPAVLAVQDLLKQQLQHTRNFISRSETFHKSALASLSADYQYTSLEETRAYIQKYRPK